MTEDLVTYMPTDPELQSWLDKHIDQYRISPSYTLRQVYIDPPPARAEIG